jgi:inhibitor of KinA sporulation pathway (predicted exonuclease)
VVAHLFEYVGVAGFIYLKYISTFWTSDLVHDFPRLSVYYTAYYQWLCAQICLFVILAAMANDDIRIYVDLEYCYPGMTKEKGRPSSTELRQVVQIAAIKYDHLSGKEIASFDTLTRPPFTPVLPEFFIELTGITQSEVGRGAAFPEALSTFLQFCGDAPVYTFDKDWEVLRQNCSYYPIPFPFEGKPFTRVKPLLGGWGVDAGAYSSGTLYKAAGLQMDGHVHNALHDVRSMAAAIHYFDERAGGAKLAR